MKMQQQKSSRLDLFFFFNVYTFIFFFSYLFFVLNSFTSLFFMCYANSLFLHSLLCYFFVYNFFFFSVYTNLPQNFFFLKSYYVYCYFTNFSVSQLYWIAFGVFYRYFLVLRSMFYLNFLVMFVSNLLSCRYLVFWKPLFKRSSYYGYFRSSRTYWLD